jgi:hypothetical protein
VDYIVKIARNYEEQKRLRIERTMRAAKESVQFAKWFCWLTVFLSILVFALFRNSVAHAVEIDHERICQIESNCNARAKRETSTDRSYGLYQISPIVLEEWNNFHPRHQYRIESLFDPYVNYTIYNWYMNKRIPQMLKHFGKPDTVRNRIIAYNAGISYVAHDKPIPSITKRYLEKYGVNQ